MDLQSVLQIPEKENKNYTFTLAAGKIIAAKYVQARFASWIQPATSNARLRLAKRIASYDAAILPLPAGTLTQLEMFQKRLNVLGKTLGHTPSLGVFCWLEVTDFDRFFGSLFLVLHVCYLSFAIR